MRDVKRVVGIIACCGFVAAWYFGAFQPARDVSQEVPTLLAQAEIIHGQGDHDRAIQLYDAVLDLNSTVVVAWNNRGAAWQSKGDHERALSDFDEAIRLAPENVDAYNNRGLSWQRLGDFAKAMAE